MIVAHLFHSAPGARKARRWGAKERAHGLAEPGPQGLTAKGTNAKAKGTKCKSWLTAARAHGLAEPGQWLAGCAASLAAW